MHNSMNFLMRIKLVILLLVFLTISTSARPVDDLTKDDSKTCSGWVKWKLNPGYNPNDYAVYVGSGDSYLYSNSRKDIQLNTTRTSNSITVHYRSDAQSSVYHPMYLCEKSRFVNGTSSGHAHDISDNAPCDDWCKTVRPGGHGCPPNPPPVSTAQKDYGDAPDIGTKYNYSKYNSSTWKNAERVTSGVFLGSKVTAEEHGHFSTHADGDSDDAITDKSKLLVDKDADTYSVQVRVSNKGSGTYTHATSGKTQNLSKWRYISAWIDWNNNGIYDNSELINSNVIGIPKNEDSMKTLTWNVPSGLHSGDKRFMRIRLTQCAYGTKTDSENASYKNCSEADNGYASFGEIEDYEIEVKGETSNTGALGMLLTRGDGNNNDRTNIYAFDVDIDTDTITNFHLVKKLNQKFRSLVYHDGKYITAGMDGRIYHLDPTNGDAILDDHYGKIDNKGIMALDFDNHDNMIYTIWSSSSSKLKKLYKYNKFIHRSSVVKTFPENLDGAIAYFNSNKYTTSVEDSAGIKNVINGSISDVPSSHDEYCVYGGEKVTSSKAYFINAESSDLTMYASTGSSWSKFYNYGHGSEGNTGGLKGMAVAIETTKKEAKKFICQEESFLFTSPQSADYTDYYSINLGQSKVQKENRFGTSHINSTGYNVKDNYIYGFEYGNDDSTDPENSYHIVKIDADFTVERLDIPNLPKRRFYLGDVSMDGTYYFARRTNERVREIERVDLKNQKLLSKITLQYNTGTEAILSADFAFNPKDNQLYMVNAINNQLMRVDKSSGKVEELGYVGDIGDTYSVISFFDEDGYFYFYAKGSQKIYRINISNPNNIDARATEFADTGELISSGDGARCANAPVTSPPLDFGDAPSAYTHVRHKISNRLFMGRRRPDAEKDQQSSMHATGDGRDDNDGVRSLPTLTVGDSTYSVPIKVYNNTGKDAYITAWIDFNRDNIFQYKEALNSNNLKVSSSFLSQTINVKWSNSFENQLDNITAGKAIMRIRLSTSRILRCDDPHYKENGDYSDNYLLSPDGEVEDYEITILGEDIELSKDGTCWVIDDENKTLYTFNMSTLEAPKLTAIDEVNEGEGLAYRPSTHELYMWNHTQTIVRDPESGKKLRTYENSYAREIEGASFYINPTTQKEELWVILEDKDGPGDTNYKDRYIQQIDINNNCKLIASTRKKLVGGFMDPERNIEYGNDIGSLAIDPKDGQFWITHDAYERKLAKLNSDTGEVTNVQTLTPTEKVDAEVLAFDNSGVMYTESDNGGEKTRYLWQIDSTTAKISKATVEFGLGEDGDLEGMACDAGKSAVKKDFGDAPKDYNHVSHLITPNLFLGNSAPDNESDQQSSTHATGDGRDDNDAVTLLPTLAVGDTSYTVPVKVYNNSGKDAYITAWIDFNRNNKFEYNEALNTNALTIPNSSSFQNIDIVWDTLTDSKVAALNSATAGKAIMRIRLSTSRVLRCDSENYSNDDEYSDNYFVSPDGEVEDYEITIKKAPRLKGKFNIERTDSSSFEIMTHARNAWYTQIAGRDFDYSLVFYNNDFTKEQNVSNVTVNVELVNEDTNAVLYEYKFHIPATVKTSRIDIIKTIPIKDLNKLPATKRAIFRVTYGVNTKGNIIQANCLENPTLCTDYRSDDAKDNFAIRPENFYITIADEDTIRKKNSNDLYNPLRVASGYEYNLTVIATQFPKTKYDATQGYNSNFDANIEFTSSGKCADERNGSVEMNFNDGKFNDLKFTNDNVGNYLLKVKDTRWSAVDFDKNVTDCIVNSSIISKNPNLLSGCNIKAITDINLAFYPYQFGVDFNMNNLPSSGHNDFLYMSQLNNIDNNVSLQFIGQITAQNKKSGTTTNFTTGCVAKDTQLLTNTDMLTDEGNGATRIQTIIHPTTHLKDDVNITRMSLFNNEGLNLANYASIINMDAPLNIPSSRFLDENNGTLFLELRYNIDKHLSLPINPVQLTVQDLTANSVMASSTAEGMIAPDPYVPTGIQDFNNTIRNFYFSRVSPGKPNYPKIVFTDNPVIRTPLNIDIYCDSAIAYCNETGVRGHTNLTGVAESQVGWYISTDHHTALDGEVQQLIPDSGTVTVAPNSNIQFIDGRNGVITDTFNACNGTNDRVRVEIVPDTALLYAEDSLDGHPFYFVSCTDQNSSELSGIGQTGNIIRNKANANQTSKIDW